MKQLVLGVVVALSAITGAEARSISPLVPERVVVKTVSLEGDFMPPIIGSGQPLTVLTVQVDSNGCTTAEDFRVLAEDVADGKQLTLIRVRPDTCRGYFPQGREIKLTTDAVSFGEEIFIANPVRFQDNTSH